MCLQLSIYNLVHNLAALVGAITSFFAWQRRSVPGRLWLFFLGMAAIGWTLANAPEELLELGDKAVVENKQAYKLALRGSRSAGIGVGEGE
jgi:hypothetical protein